MDDSAHAVDETKMDVTMMEDDPEVMDEGVPVASVPTVALSGSAKMGLKRVDDNTSTKPEDDDIKTVVEYEVTFKSSGVTDGGLQFGASISIDEDGKGAADKNGVNAASVYIGSADGTWKLQFGSNDPGIDLVPAVGLADADDISDMTLTILPLMYDHDVSTAVTLKRVMLTPTFPASRKGMTYTATLDGPVSSRDTSGGLNNWLVFASDAYLANYTTPVSYVKQKDVAGALKYDVDRYDATHQKFRLSGTNMPAPPPGRAAMALTGTIDSVSYALTAGEGGSDAWSVGVKYDPGVFYVSAGADSNDVTAFGAGGTFAGNTVKATYAKLDAAETYFGWLTVHFPGENVDRIPYGGAEQTVNEMEAYGLSLARDIGAGSNVALTYSRLTDKTYQGTFVGNKQWELDFTYDLGGGASFYAGIEQADKSEFKGKYNVKVSDTVEDEGTRHPATLTKVFKKSKVTTLETGITMKF